MNKKLRTAIKWVIVYPSVVFLCMEISLRIVGYQGFYNEDYKVSATPENAYIGHEKLGIQLNPGRYSITLNDKIHFTANHEKGNHRFVPENIDPANPDVLFLGCSFTYGYGVNDDENFPALIQKEFPNRKVRNAGVIGYGTVQSLMQLKEAIENGGVKTVILNFSSFHFIRNTLSQQYRSNLKIGYERSSSSVNSQMKNARFPYITSNDSKIQFEPWETMYSNWTGREWFATINWFQSHSDINKDRKLNQVDITGYIIKEMAVLCKENGIQFGVVCLDYSAETKKLKQKLSNIAWLDIHFNFKSKKLTNLPYDSHPNKRGHEFIAKKIEPFLKSLDED